MILSLLLTVIIISIIITILPLTLIFFISLVQFFQFFKIFYHRLPYTHTYTKINQCENTTFINDITAFSSEFSTLDNSVFKVQQALKKTRTRGLETRNQSTYATSC